MKSMQTWSGVMVVLTLAFALSACKSRAKRGCTTCAPPTAMAQQPPLAQYEGDFPDTTATLPPAPQVPSDPSVTQADLDAAHSRADQEARLRADAEAQVRAEQERLARTDAELEAARRKIEEMANAPTGPIENAPVVADTSAVESLMQDLRSKSNADVLRDGDMIIVRVTNGFRAGSDLLKRDVQLITTLNATADALARYPGASVSVVGHSDTDPIKVSKKRWKDNDQLSLARAQRVASVLATNGVDSNRISIDGRGAREPLIAPERSRSDKARNRRVEIMIRM